MQVTYPSHPSAGAPTVRHIYRDTEGAPVLIANRYEPKGKPKFFLPYDVTRQAWKAPAKRPLYNLDRIASDPEAQVWFVEGEKCADALTDLGFLATTTFGGCKAWAKTNLSPLKGRNVVIWPDNDKPGEIYANTLESTLTEIGVKTCNLLVFSTVKMAGNTINHVNFPLPAGWDAADAIASGWTAEMIQNHANFCSSLCGPKGNSMECDEVKADSLDLWHSPEREAFASIVIGNHVENWPIGSTAFRDLLSFQHYRAEGKMLTQNALEDRRRALSGEALFAGEAHKVFLRIGETGRTLYLNLGDKDWRGVAIDVQGWQVLDRPPVRFQRSSSMMALPLPVRHPEGIEALRPFLNVANEADFKLLVSWLIGCFHPRGPYPILILTGEQGSAKSTTARVLRSLIDPANPIARSAPYSEQDLVIAAKHNHVMAFDNLSSIKPGTADALCRIATGGGFGTRKLHSDTDEVLFTATRPILLNGIPDLAHRPDLADRALIITLPVISASNRQFEAEFWRAFDRAAPGILAALLDGVSAALRRIGTVTLTERPRMADFAKWATAAEPAFAWPDGAFMQAYTCNRQSVQDAAFDGNPVAEAILLLVQDHGPWNGTATDLLKALRLNSPLLTEDAQSFPRQPNRLSSELRRLQPLLRHRGVTLSVSREGRAGIRTIHIATA